MTSLLTCIPCLTVFFPLIETLIYFRLTGRGGNNGKILTVERSILLVQSALLGWFGG